MTAIKISVIIPAYNAASTIVATVQSVLDQSAPPHEVIIVNDASTDGTESLLLKHFESQITYILLKENKGPAHARNVGLAKATGAYIAFQDADDIWHSQKLELMQRVIAKHPEIYFIYHPYTLSPVDFELDAQPDIKITRYPFQKLLLSNPIGTPCVIMKAHNGGIRFDERMHYMEDYDLFLREGYEQGVYFLNIPLTQVGRPILSAGGQSANRWRMRKGEFQAYLHLAKLNPFFLLLTPFLIGLGLIKHLIKSFRPPRTNY